ncbi:hypothetical protein CCACVL1_12399 [Corchorus capsularis]|uniref:Uncharacterized protein n=1 Tax=Corchorus capsularis TaxID=210143 RepID=A0A1R3IFV2_COCAP|nr:hypothetical protein CCACVL1_12399 [Corchorus capsularis]
MASHVASTPWKLKKQTGNRSAVAGRAGFGFGEKSPSPFSF